MNLLVFEPAELGVRLPRSDRRVEHVRKILKRGIGDEVLAGLAGVEGGSAPIGRARIDELDEAGARFSFIAEGEAPPLLPLGLLLGLPRPIQANRILKDLCSLGLERIVLAGTELGEKSYADSDLYLKGDFRRPLLEGAEQAGNPRLPSVSLAPSLREAIRAFEAEGAGAAIAERLVLDPYRASLALGDWRPSGPGAVVLAIGSERGWTERELDLLGAHGFVSATLGERILKTETAALAASAIVLAKLGYL